jgi:hypothetical protein
MHSVEYLTILRHMTGQNQIFIFGKKGILLGLIIFCLFTKVSTQSIYNDSISFFEPAPIFSKPRFWTITMTGAVAYTGTMIGLNELWYKQYPRGKFHFFNDWKEWNQMDKAGHLFSTYFESVYAYKGAKWAGIKENDAIWIGAGVGLLLQTSVEVLDGFSTNWGFSVPDFAFNTLGATSFVVQQKAWGEQRIAFKVSATKRAYYDATIYSENGAFTSSLERRAEDLYGAHLAETFLKDYNAQTIWASINISSFLDEEARFPKWLNIAVGYGAENMFGGFENTWEENGQQFSLQTDAFPRYRQFYFSPDIDFTRIPTKKPLIKTLLSVLNIFKFPAPALELNTEGKVKIHALHY